MGDKELWERVKVGRPPLFKTPEDFLKLAIEYFEHVDKNPWIEAKGVGYQGEYEIQDIPKRVPYTIQGLCRYLNIVEMTLRAYKRKPEFSSVIALVEGVIYENKYKGAASGFFNANIIARDLGLKDRTDVTTDDEPIKLDSDDNMELARKLAFALRSAKESNESPTGSEKNPSGTEEESPDYTDPDHI